MRNVLNRKKNHVSDIYFSSFGHLCIKNCQFSMNFHDNSKNKNPKYRFFIRFSTLRIFHENGSKTERGEGVHISLFGTRSPNLTKEDMFYYTSSVNSCPILN